MDAPANSSMHLVSSFFDLDSGTTVFLPTTSLCVPASHASFFTLHQTHHRTPETEPGAMRYQDWDILLYPKGCDVPFKEFKTACYAVQEDGGGGAMSGNGTFATTDGL
jgi:hypothetical protein